MGSALPALLGRAADPAGQPARRVRGVAALQPVPAVPRRPRRRGRRRPHPRRSRCARTCSRSAPARSSARTRTSTATAPSPGASRPARSRSAPTRWSASSRCSTSARCWATAPSWATRRRCSPGRWSRTARAGTARPPSRATSTTGWSPPARCGRLRRFAYGLWQLANVLVLSVPLGLALVLHLPRAHPAAPTADAARHDDGRRPGFYLQCSATSRCCSWPAIARRRSCSSPPSRAWCSRGRARTPCTRSTGSATGSTGWSRGLTNSRFYCILFGDSSAILHYLRFIGYRFGRPLVQSGSNFGVEVRHENPYLSGVGSGTMVSDGLSFMNAEFSSTSFRLRRAELGDRNFLGNDIAYPPGARTGDNCLLATKVMVPIHGRIRQRRRAARVAGVRDPAHGRARPRLRRPEERRRHRRLLRAKNRHNTAHRGAVPARAVGEPRRRRGARHGGPRPLLRARVLGRAAGRRRGARVQPRVPDPARTGGHVVPGG